MNIFNCIHIHIHLHIHTTEHIPAYGFHHLLLLCWASMWSFNCISGLCTSLCGLPNLWCWSGNSRWRWGNEQDYNCSLKHFEISAWGRCQSDQLCNRDIFLSRNIESHLQHYNTQIRCLTPMSSTSSEHTHLKDQDTTLNQNLKAIGLWVFPHIYCPSYSFLSNVKFRAHLEFLTIVPSSVISFHIGTPPSCGTFLCTAIRQRDTFLKRRTFNSRNSQMSYSCELIIMNHRL